MAFITVDKSSASDDVWIVLDIVCVDVLDELPSGVVCGEVSMLRVDTLLCGAGEGVQLIWLSFIKY